jgi:hypothetical protein
LDHEIGLRVRPNGQARRAAKAVLITAVDAVAGGQILRVAVAPQIVAGEALLERAAERQVERALEPDRIEIAIFGESFAAELLGRPLRDQIDGAARGVAAEQVPCGPRRISIRSRS